MENASKALIMAGSILLALLIISLLIFGYGQLSEWQQTSSDSDANTKLGEYMRKFEQFNRDISNPFYGSELFSLANLQADYKETQGKTNITGYAPIEITVIITKPIAQAKYFRTGTFDLSQILDMKERLETKLATFNENKYTTKDGTKRSVKYYAYKTAREIVQDFFTEEEYDKYFNWNDDIRTIEDELSANGKTEKLMQDIQEFTNLDAEYTEFKTGKRFYCTNVTYDEGNGRIETMTFQEL